MKTVKVEFPIQEAVELLRLARGESRCLIEQTEYMPDMDIVKRINIVQSARERLCTSLEGIAELEDVIEDPSQMAFDIAKPPRRFNDNKDSMLDEALAIASGEKPSIAVTHGVPMPNEWDQRILDEEHENIACKTVANNHVRPTLPVARKSRWF
jgi:hypothetical protein